jgi:glycosyltransferase involved in cell wall biosynthesis
MVYVTYIGNFLSVHGYNPTVAESLVPMLKEQGFYVRFASSHLNPIARMLDMLKTVMVTPKARSCVIIDLFSGPKAFIAAKVISDLCHLLGRKYVLVLHGGGLPERWNTSRKTLFKMLKGARAVVSPSPFLARFFSEHVDVLVIPNGIAVENYAWRVRDIVQPSILFLRAFHKLYDPITAIMAFHRVWNKHKDAYLTMAGPDEDGTLKQCQSLVDELGINNAVYFLGRVPKSDIPKIGIQHDIFINSSLVDNTPVSTIEAMAMGLCIVATSVGGLPYLLQHEETALLVLPGDPESMSEAILRILRDPDLARRLSTRAREVAEGMSWSKVIPQWVNLIQKVVDET